MRGAPSRLVICLPILASVGIVLIAMVGSGAATAARGLAQRHDHGWTDVMRQRPSAVRRRAMALRRAHHHRPAMAIGEPQPRADGGHGSLLGLVARSIVAGVHRVAAHFDHRMIEQSCLANAIYFEARSESEDGQRAVATVILNRVEAPNFPSTICDVVYQGASRLNACQFSFACDGKPDLPRPGRALAEAVAVAAEALSGGGGSADKTLQLISTATFYHADYVKPRWSRSLTRLTKIGHHIFYSQGETS